MEAEERLAQLDFLIFRISTLQELAAKTGHAAWVAGLRARDKSGKDRFLERNRLSSREVCLLFEVKLSAEAFYYFAARLIGILNLFPGLKNFGVPGIRNVRNRLIEHPEKGNSGVTQQNWGCDGKTGPRLKTSRRLGQENVPQDAGLFLNAADLRDCLKRRLGELLRPSTKPV
jgi:hypothetical protein